MGEILDICTTHQVYFEYLYWLSNEESPQVYLIFCFCNGFNGYRSFNVDRRKVIRANFKLCNNLKYVLALASLQFSVVFYF